MVEGGLGCNLYYKKTSYDSEYCQIYGFLVTPFWSPASLRQAASMATLRQAPRRDSVRLP